MKFDRHGALIPLLFLSIAAQASERPAARTLQFSGLSFEVASGRAFVDELGRLHLGSGSEVRGERPLGHGTYSFSIKGRLDQLEPHQGLELALISGKRRISVAVSRFMDAERRTPLLRYAVTDGTEAGSVVAEAALELDMAHPAKRTEHSFSWALAGVTFRSSGGFDRAPLFGGKGHDIEFPPLDMAPDDARVRIRFGSLGGDGAAPDTPEPRDEDAHLIIRSLDFSPAPD